MQIESKTKSRIKTFPSAQTVEIKGNSYQQVVQAHMCILDMYKITPRPTEYQVMGDLLIASVQGYTGSRHSQEEVVEIEEYPKLDMKYDHKWQGFITRIENLPKECVDFLLNDQGIKVKKLQSEMKGNVEFVVNKTENYLEIVGYTKAQVREGYAVFARILKNTCAAVAYMKLISSTKSNLPQRIQKSFLKNQRFTHFLSVNLEKNPDLSRLQQYILGLGIEKLTPRMINHPNRFHITIAVLSLDYPDEVITCVNRLTPELQSVTMNKAITLTFDRIGYFGKPNAASVLYVDLLRDKEFARFNQISTKLHQALLKQGILTQSDLSKQKTELTGNTLTKQYHMTLAKNKGTTSFLDLTNVLNRPLQFNIQVLVTDIQLMSMRTEAYKSSYPILFSKQLT